LFHISRADPVTFPTDPFTFPREAETMIADKEHNHLWDLAETADGNLPQSEDVFEEKFTEWQQRNWMRWLQDNLSFPFIAERTDDDDDAYFNSAVASKPFSLGHKMKVLALVNEDDLYGIIVKVREGRRTGSVPLCDLRVLPPTDKNYWPVREYSVWFANR